MNRLSRPERAKMVGALVEGTRSAPPGAACADFQNAALRDLPTTHVGCEEIWAYSALQTVDITATLRREAARRQLATQVAPKRSGKEPVRRFGGQVPQEPPRRVALSDIRW